MGKHTLSFPGLGIGEFTIDSVAFTLFGKISINWYSLIITTGIIVAVLYVWFRFKEHKYPLDDLIDYALWIVPCGILGARLYYIIFKLDYYIVTFKDGFFANLGESLRRMIAVWEGGLAIYGGIIAGAIAAILVARHKKKSILQMLDFLAPAVMIAQAIGRWGNFMNAEAHGGITELPWRMGILEGEVWNYYHPTFFYESLWNVIGFLLIHFIFVKNKRFTKFEGQICFMYLAWYGFGRMIIEGLRTDSLYLFGFIRISQLVGLLCFLGGVGIIVYKLIKQRKVKENG